MDKIKMKEDIRYVAATMDNVPLFIMNDVLNQKFALTDNIGAAVKSMQRSTIRDVIGFYHAQFGEDVQQRDFTILPILVTYQILDGDNNGTSGVD